MAKFSGLGGRLYSGETSFNIVENRKRWYSISAVFLLISLGALIVQGLHLGLEFKGGASFTLNKPNVSIEQARASVENIEIPGEIIVQKIGDTKVRIQTGALTSAESTAIETALTTTFDVTARVN
jgi:preprotein translocase subunit SecF